MNEARRTRPPVAPSGEQFEITAGEQRATVVEVGGGIRCYAVGGRNVLDPYPVEAMCDGAHGTPLIPWPNRLGDGRYSFDGHDYQVALTEPTRHNAIHGFLRWRQWRAVERKPDRVVMGVRLHPLSGYPFALDARVGYALDADGLTVTTTVTNIGERDCPFGAGQHPYLSPGDGPIDDCSLQVPAAARILTDDERSLPCGREPVSGTQLDFADGVTIGARQIDSAFTDLDRDGNGFAAARLTAPDGSAVELWMDAHFPYMEIYTGDDLAPARRRRGLAVEPMTCAPDAFRSGEGLLRLAPGEYFSGRWGVRLLGAG
jgi:aldose 1-epimerase